MIAIQKTSTSIQVSFTALYLAEPAREHINL